MRLINGLLNPQRAALKAWKSVGTPSFNDKLDYDLFDRPHYAYCLANAARSARALGIEAIAALEFGVAGGRGLLALEALATEVEREYGVRIEIYGFDTGEGLPAPVDYRDLPYVWQTGFFRMDQDKLKQQLKRSQLVLGDVVDTVPKFVASQLKVPVGAIYSDLDFWSSTLASFQVFDAPDALLLPRTFIYFDDIISADGGGILSEDVGQLRAIRDYNEKSEMMKIRPIAGLEQTRRIRAKWNAQIYVHHRYNHARYDDYIHADANRQLAIA
jgi:hypothetical protein